MKLITKKWKEDENGTMFWTAFTMGYNFVIANWFEEVDNIIDTLIALLSDSDRRVVVLSILYLGLIQDTWGKVGTDIGRIKEAIGPIDIIAKRASDKNVGIAAGMTNASLGSPSAIVWMAESMARAHQTSEDEFKKLMRYSIVNQIKKGWK